jgi:Ca2+/Na+ antiporter
MHYSNIRIVLYDSLFISTQYTSRREFDILYATLLSIMRCMHWMVSALAAMGLGIIVLVVSADKFVAGASALALHLGLPPLPVGMVIV